MEQAREQSGFMLFKINCPKCGIEGAFSLVESSYNSPYRCWKCCELFTLIIEDNKLKSCEPLDPDEFERQQELKNLKDKFNRS